MPDPFVLPDETRRSYHSGRTGTVLDVRDGGTVFDPVDYATYQLRSIPAIAEAMPEAADDSVLTVSFATAKYRPPAAVVVRTSVDGWAVDHFGEFRQGMWVFQFPGPEFASGMEMKFVLGGFWMIGGNAVIPFDQRHRHFTDREVYFVHEVRFRTEWWQPNHLVTLRNSTDGWGRDVYGVFRGDSWVFRLDLATYPSSLLAKLVLARAEFMAGEDLLLDAQNPTRELTDAEVQFPNSSPDATYRHGYDNLLPVESPLEQVTVRATGTEAEEYDVIVIGSGMGGGILADALSNRGLRVLVLDAGGLWFPVHMNELPGLDTNLAGRDELGSFVNRPNSDLFPGVLFNLGGRSVYWSGLIPRMREWEMQAWPPSVCHYLTQPGTDNLSGYERAERLMRKGRTLGPFQDQVRLHLGAALGAEFEVADLPRTLHQPNLDGQNRIQNVLEKPTGVFSTADLLLDSLGFDGPAGRLNLRVNLHHLATRLTSAGSRVTGVVCQDLVGNVERQFTGRAVVLACGSLESPKLAMLSGLTDPSGKMGRGLTDHPAFFYRHHHDLPRTGPLGWVGDSRGHAKLLVQHQYATPGQHGYNIEVLINAKYWDARHADPALWDQLMQAEQVSKVEVKFIFDSPLDDGNSITPRGPGQKLDVFVRNNHRGEPYKEEVVQVRNAILTALGIDPYELTDHWVDDEWGQGVHGSVHHAGGTLRMGPTGAGVVDDQLKFHAYDNLYCCDVSVFPAIPAANPSLTLAALALRLADTLSYQLLPSHPDGGES